ncbi:MAG: pentapeptide repeat-containing protein [Myxococcales bacterium]|nr:pentapeptide repeat-containing protein [Myxococcales bacterium]
MGASLAGASLAGASLVGASLAGASLAGASSGGASSGGASSGGASSGGASPAGASPAGASPAGASAAELSPAPSTGEKRKRGWSPRSSGGGSSPAAAFSGAAAASGSWSGAASLGAGTAGAAKPYCCRPSSSNAARKLSRFTLSSVRAAPALRSLPATTPMPLGVWSLVAICSSKRRSEPAPVMTAAKCRRSSSRASGLLGSARPAMVVS